jgi:phage baseplate assembly protein V
VIPQSRAVDKRYYGVAAAIVSNVDDPEKEGRVKVRFPWFDSDMESEWCRVAQLYAGSGNKGSLFVPDVEDEVVVAFVHGDMREPVILGGIYNGSDKPPSFRNASKDQKLIRTRTGHEILFDETKGQERVKITTQGGHVIDCDDTAKTMKCATSGGRSITLDDTGMSITIETPDGMSIELIGGTVTIKGTTSVKLDAPKVDITSAASMSVPLGPALLAAFNAHTHNCTAPGTPSGPPLPSMVETAVCSQVVKIS